MKPITLVALCLVGAFHFAPFSPAAEPLVQVNASVEIYEFPPAEALAWQKKFEASTGPEQQKLVAQLRVGTTDKVKTVGFGERICTLGKSSTVATYEEYSYPTHFTTNNGFTTPSDFEQTHVGCTMTLKVTSDKEGNAFIADTGIRDVALLSTQHYAASKNDQPGTIEFPVFATQTVETEFKVVPGVPKLVSVYSPYKDDKAPKTLRLVFVTVRADR